MQNVEVNEVTLGDKKYLEFEINMYPIELYIMCKKFNIFSNTQKNEIDVTIL